MARLTDRIIKRLTPPAKGNRIAYDDEVRGLGLRVTAAGAKSFVFNYRIAGKERRYTIGSYGRDSWTLTHAKKRAGELRRMVDGGEDPLGQRIEAREAPTVADMCQRFEDEHLPKLRASTAAEYRSMTERYIKPAMGNKKVSAISFDDVDALHRRITKAGKIYRANRTLAVLSKMFSLAIRWKWRADNPAKDIERNQEIKRHRYLTGEELARLTLALAEHDDQQAANIIRLLLLTGARRGEVLAARWDQFDLEAGTWTKPGATTKQKTEHRVPLSAHARQLLTELRAYDEYVFPGRGSDHRVDIKRNWAAICKAANITGARIHDLRHTYASVLASAGLSLPIIGALLGHTQAQTTQRYSHLFDDPLRAATERVGSIVMGGKSAEVVKFRKGAG